MGNMAKYKYPWVKLWRQSERNELYFSEPFDKWHAWQDLMILADDSGTVKTSLRRLKTRWNWSSVRQVVKHLETLSETGQIAINGTPSGTVITLTNWEKYQRKSKKNGTPKKPKSETVFGTQEVLIRSSVEPSQGSAHTTEDIIDDFDITKVGFDD